MGQHVRLHWLARAWAALLVPFVFKGVKEEQWQGTIQPVMVTAESVLFIAQCPTLPIM